ncbi:uncharacterized protein LOC117344662 [Pecten maximus]|uniref:uncharacterized protein LOC117344662 n=1 Tax=Pecten maximus TaxID=6579 RepID=UPI0014585B12|nr:uncharacterized protein LOC117344662 [Pecten maximus]
MALNRSDRCSTCLRKCYVTSGQNPIKMSCGHHTCFRCHQTQWLTSERNDSEEIKCIKCTLAILNDKSNDKHDLLKRHPELCVRSANVRAVIKGVREPKAQTDTADKIRSHTAKDTCGSDACPQHYKGVHHHRASSSPANVFLASPETEMNSKQSHESCKDKTRRNKDTEWSSEPNDKIYKLKDMSPPSGNVLKFTQLDPKQKYGHSKKTHKNITKAKFLFPEKSSKESSVSAINKAEGRVKQPSDSQPSRQTYTKTDTSVLTLPHTSTHDQYDNEGQNEVDSTVNSDNGSKSSGRSHHKHKSSHKKSKKKKKHKEKNRTKSGQDSSLQVTDIPDGNTKPIEKQSEMSPQPRHLNTTSVVGKVEVGDTLSIHGNDEDYSSPVSGGSGMDTLSIAKDLQEEKWSFPVKKEDTLISANNEEVILSVSEENMSVFWYAGK